MPGGRRAVTMSAEELANTVPARCAWSVDTPSAPGSGNAQRFRRFPCTLITRARPDFWPAAEDGYKAVTRLTVSAIHVRLPVARGSPPSMTGTSRAPPASCAGWPALTMAHWYRYSLATRLLRNAAATRPTVSGPPSVGPGILTATLTRSQARLGRALHVSYGNACGRRLPSKHAGGSDAARADNEGRGRTLRR
jgi:hypothetical protein